MARAMLFVGGDTGPVHLADAARGSGARDLRPDANRRNVPERNRPFRGAALRYDQAGRSPRSRAVAVELRENGDSLEE